MDLESHGFLFRFLRRERKRGWGTKIENVPTIRRDVVNQRRGKISNSKGISRSIKGVIYPGHVALTRPSMEYLIPAPVTADK